MREVIAHGLNDTDIPDYRPYVPDTIIMREGPRYWTIDRTSGEKIDIGELGYNYLLESGKIQNLLEPVNMEEEKWLAIENDGVTFFEKVEEEKWRATRAKSLLDEAKAVTDPIDSLALLRASGSLVELQVEKLVGSLERQRKTKEEGLDEIYKRVKK